MMVINNNNNKYKDAEKVIIQEFVYRDTTNVEPEMYDCTSNNWSHWNSNEKLKERFGSCTRKNNNNNASKWQMGFNSAFKELNNPYNFS